MKRFFFLKNQKKSQCYKKKDTSISDLNTETLKEHCTEQFPGRQGQRARAMILLFSFYWHKKHRPAYQKDGGSPALTDTGVYREALEMFIFIFSTNDTLFCMQVLLAI